MVAIDGAHLARPGFLNAQVAIGGALNLIAIGIDQHRLNAKKWPRRRARLQGSGAWQRRNQNAASFRLPPSINDRAAPVANYVVVPVPSFRVDRLTNRTQ